MAFGCLYLTLLGNVRLIIEGENLVVRDFLGRTREFLLNEVGFHITQKSRVLHRRERFDRYIEVYEKANNKKIIRINDNVTSDFQELLLFIEK